MTRMHHNAAATSRLAGLQRRRADLLKRQKIRLDSAHRFGISQLAALRRQRATLERTERRAEARAGQMAADVRAAAAQIDLALSADGAATIALASEQAKLGAVVTKMMPQWREQRTRWDEGQALRLQEEREEVDRQRKARHRAFREQQRRAALLALRKHELDVTKSRALQEDRARSERKDAFAREVVNLDKAIHAAARKRLTSLRRMPTLGSDLSDASRGSSAAGSRVGSDAEGGFGRMSSGSGVDERDVSRVDSSPVRARVNSTAAAIQAKLARMQRLRAEAESSGSEIELSPSKPKPTPTLERRSPAAASAALSPVAAERSSPSKSRQLQPARVADVVSSSTAADMTEPTTFTPTKGATAAGGSSPAFDFQRPSPATSLDGSQSEAERGDIDSEMDGGGNVSLDETLTPAGVSPSDRPAALTQWKEELRRQKEGTEALFAQMNEEDPAIGAERSGAGGADRTMPLNAEADDAGAAAAGGVEVEVTVERRMGSDGYAYTYEQFVEHYGRDDEWDAAQHEHADADDSLHYGDWSQAEVEDAVGATEEYALAEEQPAAAQYTPEEHAQYGQEQARYAAEEEEPAATQYTPEEHAQYDQEQAHAHAMQYAEELPAAQYTPEEQAQYEREQAQAGVQGEEAYESFGVTTPAPAAHGRITALQQRYNAPQTPPTPAGNDWAGVENAQAAAVASPTVPDDVVTAAAPATPKALPPRPAAAVTPPSELSESNTSFSQSASFGDGEVDIGFASPAAAAPKAAVDAKKPRAVAVARPKPKQQPPSAASAMSSSRLQNQRQRRMSKGMSVRCCDAYARARLDSSSLLSCNS